MSVPKWLIDLGIPEKCISRSSSAHEQGGIRVVIVLSKGKKTRKRSKELARIQKRFGVTVHITTTRLEVKGVDALPK